ncbi:NAD(P)/FAD-dependent oxidoreductase [Candidatus Bathyarchaeota archaeon]|nr:NAD(P)/FAD-dependent oxidoreductase [Candidatus Bathyarchaeota archaeon]
MANGLPNGGHDGATYVDTLIIGAGISGINAAYRLQTGAPADMSYAILEGRDSLGGTWDLFRYPGIRSDSDVYTFCFSWNPWKHEGTMASGERLKEYMEESTKSQGIDQHILYRHRVNTANWRSDLRNWELEVFVPGRDQPVTFRSRFMLLGTGYYDYEKPLEAVIPGLSNFGGKIIHPQFWPKDYDYTNKEIVVIGSGATAVTIVPAVAPVVKRVTMLQRSPSYIFPIPFHSLLTTILCAVLPAHAAHYVNRLIWILRSYLTTLLCRAWPGVAKLVFKHVATKLLPPDIPYDPHFKPRYNPWDQRVCASVDGDFFAALRSGKADVATGTIKAVTEKTIELESGQTLHPDAIVTATGLRLRFGGGIQFMLDGVPFKCSDKYAWRAAMIQDVPNLLFLTGYETASWTLGADVSATVFVRILRRMAETGAKMVIPRPTDAESMPELTMMSLSSTYLKTMKDELPMGGSGVWSPKSNYYSDMAGAMWGSIVKDLEFS